MIDPTYFPPGITTPAEFGQCVMKWGVGPTGAKQAMQHLTKEQLVNVGVTKQIAENWRKFYDDEFACNPKNLTEKYREQLMRKARDLLN